MRIAKTSRWVIVGAAALLAVNTMFAVDSLNKLSAAFLDLKGSIRVQSAVATTIGDLLSSEASVSRYLNETPPSPAVRHEIEAALLESVTEAEARKAEANPEIGDFFHAIAVRLQDLRRLNPDALDADQLQASKRELDVLRSRAESLLEREEARTVLRTEEFQRAALRAALGVCFFFVGTLGMTLAIYLTSRHELKLRSQINADLALTEEATRQISERLRCEHDDLAYLNSAGSLLQTCDDFEEIGELVPDVMRRLAPGRGGAIYLCSDTRNDLKCLASWGDTGSFLPRIGPKDCWSLRLGRVHIAHCEGGSPICEHWGDDKEGRNQVCLPLESQGDILGLLTLDGIVGAATDLDDTVRKTEMLSKQLGLTISNLQLRRSLNEQLIKDPLTGAFNRRYMESVVDKEILRSMRSRRPLCIAMIDIDHFKKFNDLHGHLAGDAALISTVNFLTQNIRADDYLFRFGGEEFAILLPETSLEDAYHRLDELRRELGKNAIQYEGTTLLPVTISIGVVQWSDELATTASLLKAADQQLYEAKASGRNTVRPSMTAIIRQEEQKCA